MNGSAIPSSAALDASSFRDRGVAAPFTTPLLAAARVRLSARSGIELLLPNPSGGRGYYVVTWAGIRTRCAPTLHDTVLFQALSRMEALDPGTVRDSALTVALEGLAGRAAAAAKAALAADRAERKQAHFLLLDGLLQRSGPRAAPHATSRTPEFDRQAALALQRLGTALGRPPSQLAAAVAGLAESFAPVGVAPDDGNARMPCLIARMDDVRADLSAWASAEGAGDFAALAETVAGMLAIAVKGGRAVIESTRAVLAEPGALLKRRLADPFGTAALAQRAAWLLDGWERVCLVWRSASGPAGTRLALLEMAECLPLLPREAFNWTNPPVCLPAPGPGCRVVAGDSAWRGGSAAVLLTERNETFRA